MKIYQLNGIVPFYKPCGITSSQFLEALKKKLRNGNHSSSQIKLGHGGTLDKSASGVLVVGINKGTSKLPAFLNCNKIYKTSCSFGKATDTFNAEGSVSMEKPFEHISREQIEEALEKFHGTILQKPPAYSALKKKGRRLSDLVRCGVEVNPEPRPVNCYGTMISEYHPPKLTFGVICGAGFYVRSLVHDLGLMLNSCAHVVSLERTRQGPFTIEHCLFEEQLTLDIIRLKTEQLKSLAEEFVDGKMTDYRKKSSQWEYRK